jgi:hypothetical protein
VKSLYATVFTTHRITIIFDDEAEMNSPQNQEQIKTLRANDYVVTESYQLSDAYWVVLEHRRADHHVGDYKQGLSSLMSAE